MLKKIVCSTFGLVIALQAHAFDKKQVDLANHFWGTWSISNPKTKCTESYQFTKPGQFSYTTKQKKMAGNFTVLRSENSEALDILALKVKTDNKQAGCDRQPVNYSNADIRLSLKWLNTKTAELCTDTAGQQCTGLYLTKLK